MDKMSEYLQPVRQRSNITGNTLWPAVCLISGFYVLATFYASGYCAWHHLWRQAVLSLFAYAGSYVVFVGAKSKLSPQLKWILHKCAIYLGIVDSEGREEHHGDAG